VKLLFNKKKTARENWVFLHFNSEIRTRFQRELWLHSNKLSARPIKDLFKKKDYNIGNLYQKWDSNPLSMEEYNYAHHNINFYINKNYQYYYFWKNCKLFKSKVMKNFLKFLLKINWNWIFPDGFLFQLSDNSKLIYFYIVFIAILKILCFKSR
jgi:hypothetical protein